MGSEVRIHGENGVDNISAGTADALGVGALAAKRAEAGGVWAAAWDSTEHAELVARVFRRAGEEHVNGEAGENPVVFTEVPKPANVPRTATVVEIVLHSGHLVRVPAGVDADTLQRVLQALQTTC